MELARIRSLLFTPGDDERRLRGAFATGADAVVCDLEDGVSPEARPRARRLVARVLADVPAGAAARIVRVNPPVGAEGERDLEALAGVEADALMLPKATPEAIDALPAGGPPLLALVESGRGLRLAYETASADCVRALVLGSADLAAELGLRRLPGGEELLAYRSQLVRDSAAAGLRPPFDGVCLEIADRDRLRAECRLARALGMGGKVCIHPAQVGPVNEAFTPSEEELAWARRVLEGFAAAAADGRGAVAVEGQMVDEPIVRRARALLADAERGRR